MVAARGRAGGQAVNARPFERASCPSVRARAARATRATLRSCAALPGDWALDLPPLGSATMSFAGFDSDAHPPEAVELPVSFAAGRGRVAVESAFAARLVDTVLGGAGTFSVARAASVAERGVLAGVLAPVFDAVGGSLELGRIVPRDAAASRDTAWIVFRLETAVVSGWLRLAPPPGDAFARGRQTEIWRARAGRVPVVGRIEIAATGLPASAVARVVVGDAIVFDGTSASRFAPGAAWDARLRVGGHAVDVVVDDAKLSIAGGFSPVPSEERNMSASGSNTDPTTVLAAASIEVVAELGRISLRGDELLGLAPGAVLALGTRSTNVVLRVGGEHWADGEIVDIDGELGVRVTRVANR